MPEANEGRVIGKGADDKAFHAPILGDDQLPPELLARLKSGAARLGLDPDLVQR